MMISSLLAFAFFALPACARHASVFRRGPVPGGIVDPGANPGCTLWHDNVDGSLECAMMPYFYDITPEQLLSWVRNQILPGHSHFYSPSSQNPTLTSECGNWQIGHSYCVEVAPQPSSISSSAPIATSAVQSTPMRSTAAPTPSTLSSRTSAKPSSTSAGNGVVTPQPTQPGMVSNCAKFHWIAKGVSCSQVISYQKITLADFVKWNPTVKDDCSGMWAEVNVCVGFIASSTTTTAGNGIQTPLPTQPGMVSNCNKFHYIAPGVVCSQVTSYQKISMADFIKWNPTVGSDCSSMQANVNVCVGVIGGSTTTPTPTTSAGNGTQTPQPTQPGMVTNCKKFHYVAEGVVCSQIISYQKITLADFVKWNPGVGSDCRTMWAKTHVCVGV